VYSRTRTHSLKESLFGLERNTHRVSSLRTYLRRAAGSVGDPTLELLVHHVLGPYFVISP